MAPAIRLARNGFHISYSLAQNLRAERALFQEFDGSRHIFLHDGNLYEPGAILRQVDLARTLAAIASTVRRPLHSGAAAGVVATMGKYHGLITREDLEHTRPSCARRWRPFPRL